MNQFAPLVKPTNADFSTFVFGLFKSGKPVLANAILGAPYVLVSSRCTTPLGNGMLAALGFPSCFAAYARATGRAFFDMLGVFAAVRDRPHTGISGVSTAMEYTASKRRARIF